MPSIGKRMIKSAAAVFLCLCIDLLRNHQGMPFYSAVAAILCIQPYVENSKRVAWNRVVGTFIGAIYGIVFLVLERMFLPTEIIIVRYAVVSVFVLFIIYTTVLVRKNEAAYIACVVFLGIAITHGEDINVYSFALNRMLDTLIGIGVALIVNMVDTWKGKDSDTLYGIHLDYVMTKTGELSTYAVIKMNQLLERGAKLILMTKKNPCELLPHLSDVNIEYPIICMNGSLIYDVKKNIYIQHQDLTKEVTHKLLDILEDKSIYYHAYSCRHDFLYIYYQEPENRVQKKMLEGMSEENHHHFVKRRMSHNFTGFSIHAVAQSEKIRTVQAELQTLSYAEEFQLICHKDKEQQEYMHMEIYRNNVSEELAIKDLQNLLSVKDSLIFGAVEKVASQKEMFRAIEKVYHG